MKNLIKSLIAFNLGLIARAVVHRYHPQIVMVTGSVGKTATKDAVACALTAKYMVRKSEKSFNSEFGVPFTILGVRNPWGNPIAWLSLIKSSIALLILPNHYPNMLVLEVGADRPGDLIRILRIATPDAVVVTRLPEIPVHVEAYTSPGAVREEEFSPAYALRAGAPLIIPADTPHALNLAKGTPARVITYGISEHADVRIHPINCFVMEGRVSGMAAHVIMNEEKRDIVVRGSVGKTQVLPIAAALAVASAFSIPTSDALAALESYVPPPGRGRLLAGKNDSTIIDDSYNASPAAVEEALATLKTFPLAMRGTRKVKKGRRVAILGDMLELGRYSVQEHERIGTLAAASADMLVTVGIRAHGMARHESTTETLLFDDSRTAARALAEFLRPDDVVLVKGSQSIRMERVVEALLADPADATKLVRQDRGWKKKV